MSCSPRKSALLLIVTLISATSLMAAGKPPRLISVTDIPPSNAAELSAEQNAEITFRQAAQKADTALKKARIEGGKWRKIADLLMQSSVTSRSGDFQTATKMADHARFMAEESYNAVIAARKAEAEREAAAAKKAAEEKAAAATRKAAVEKRSASPATATK